MRKIKLILLGFLLLAPLALSAQQYVVLKTDNFTAAGNGATVRTIGTSMTFVRISWNIVGGTLSACSVKIQTAAAQGGPFSDLAGSTATCTSNGAGTFIGTTPNYIRAVLVTKTGSATTLTTTLVGWQALPVAVITAPGAPVGACTDGTLYQNTSNGDLYLCESSTWVLISFGGGGALSGSGTANTLTKWTGAATLGNSLWTDNATTSAYTGTGGVVSPIFKSNAADIADAGILRLASGESVCWEASPTGTDFCISGNSSEQVEISAPIKLLKTGSSNGLVTDVSALTGNRTITSPDANTVLPVPSIASPGFFVTNFGNDGQFATAAVAVQTPVSFSATPTFTATSFVQSFKITLTGDVTSSTLSGATAGAKLSFLICQDGTGNWTFAWPTNVKGGMAAVGTASTCNAQEFLYDGTNAYAVSSGVGGM